MVPSLKTKNRKTLPGPGSNTYTDIEREETEAANLDPPLEAAPPQRGPGPPLKGTMSGSSLSAGSSVKGMRALPAADVALSESGVAGRCSRPRLTGRSHRLGSAVTPALAMCTGSRSYCVLYGAICDRPAAKCQHI